MPKTLKRVGYILNFKNMKKKTWSLMAAFAILFVLGISTNAKSNNTSNGSSNAVEGRGRKYQKGWDNCYGSNGNCGLEVVIIG